MGILILSLFLAGLWAGFLTPFLTGVAGAIFGRAERWLEIRRSLLFASFSSRTLIMVQVALGVPLAILGGATQNLACGLASITALAGPPMWIHRALQERRRRLEAQLDRTVSDLADALRTSGSLNEALRRVASHAMPPISQELDLVLREVGLGMDLESALEGLVARSRSMGAASMAMAMAIGRRTGGDLPRILEAMAQSLREQKRLEGVLKTKTAEGRGQAWVLGAIPPVLIGFLSLSNPDWLDPLWKDPVGWIILGLAALLEGTAVFLVKRLVTFTA